MSDFIQSLASVRLLKANIFPFYRQCVQNYDMGDKSKTMAFFLSSFLTYSPALRLQPPEKQSSSRGLSDITMTLPCNDKKQ